MWNWIQAKLTTLAKSDHPAAIGGRLFIGLAFGVGVLIVAEGGLEASLWRRVLSEIAVAIIVATVSVFAIELRAHDKLINRIVSKITETSQAHFERLAAMIKRSARDALPGVLSEVFKNQDPRLYDDTMAVISSFESMETTKSWTDRVAKRFIGQLYAFVSENATSLVQANKSGGAYDITLPPSSVHLADIILAGMMDELEAGDSYIVVSDLSSWNSELGRFFEATVSALSKGVKVRRLFCPFDYDSDLTPAEVDELLKRHWDDALFAKYRGKDKRPMYELGVLSRKSVLASQNLNIRHVGVFHHAAEIACFEPQHRDLSRMAFSKKDHLNATVLDKLWLKAHANYKTDGSNVAIVARQEVVSLLGSNWWV